MLLVEAEGELFTNSIVKSPSIGASKTNSTGLRTFWFSFVPPSQEIVFSYLTPVAKSVTVTVNSIFPSEKAFPQSNVNFEIPPLSVGDTSVPEAPTLPFKHTALCVLSAPTNINVGLLSAVPPVWIAALVVTQPLGEVKDVSYWPYPKESFVTIASKSASPAIVGSLGTSGTT